MNPSKYCATCNPEMMPDHKHSHDKKKKINKDWFSYDRMIPVVLGILVIVSTVQTVELKGLKDTLTVKAQTITQPAVAVQPAQQAPGAYQALPAQVGGC